MNSSPLDGVRILAISQFGAGPYGTQVLADLGAEVIKIEDPSTGGDVARYVPPTEVEGDSLYFQSLNRGKKSLGLDLRSDKGMAVLRDLVRVSDGLFNNLRGDLPAKLGLTYEAMKGVNPAVVCCSLSGFGTTGPRASEPGYDYLIQGLAGYMSITGEPDGPPAKCGVSVIDFSAGLAAALGLVAGILQARATGVGRDVDVSLLDTATSMLSYMAAWTLNTGWTPVRTPSSAHQTLVPSQNFQTADGWIVVFCAKERFFQKLVEIMGMPELASDPRFDSFAGRYRHRDELLPMLQERFLTRTTEDWLRDLTGSVPCAPVNSIPEALRDSQVAARGMVREVDHPDFGRIQLPGYPVHTGKNMHDVHVSQTEPASHRSEATQAETPDAGATGAPAPALGQHTDALLGDLLGYSADRIEKLRAVGVVA